MHLTDNFCVIFLIQIRASKGFLNLRCTWNLLLYLHSIETFVNRIAGFFGIEFQCFI